MYLIVSPLQISGVKKSPKEVEKQEKLQAKKKKQLEASLEREMGDEIIVAGEFIEVDPWIRNSFFKFTLLIIISNTNITRMSYRYYMY